MREGSVEGKRVWAHEMGNATTPGNQWVKRTDLPWFTHHLIREYSKLLWQVGFHLKKWQTTQNHDLVPKQLRLQNLPFRHISLRFVIQIFPSFQEALRRPATSYQFRMQGDYWAQMKGGLVHATLYCDIIWNNKNIQNIITIRKLRQ